MARRATPQQLDAPQRRFGDDTTKPSSHYFAKAIELHRGNGGYHGQYGIPGLIPARIKDGKGDIAVFSTPEEATAAAAERMIEVLNSRNTTLNTRGSNFAYEPMTPQQFSMGMAEANISPSLFSFLTGSRLNRVLGWMEGPTDKDDNKIPHVMRILLALLASDPKNIDLATAVTNHVATEKPRR